MEHRKANLTHDIKPMSSCMARTLSDIETISSAGFSADRMIAALSGAERKLHHNVTKMREEMRSIKTLVERLIEKCFAPYFAKLEEWISECEIIKSQMLKLSFLVQRKNAILKNAEQPYIGSKYRELAQAAGNVSEMKKTLDTVAELDKKVKDIQSRCEKVRIIRVTRTDSKRSELTSEFESLISKVFICNTGEMCKCCGAKVSNENPAQQCSRCKDDETYCRNCIKPCGICSADVCVTRCSKKCQICGQQECSSCIKEDLKQGLWKCNECEFGLMSSASWKLLSELTGKAIKTHTLLFKATRDGFTRAAFHSKCDKKGSTVTVIKSEFDKVFGGYITDSWGTKIGDGCIDSTAMMFSLTTKKLFRNKNSHSHYDGPNYGPWFGITYVGIGHERDNWSKDVNACTDDSSNSDNAFFEASTPRISGSTTRHFRAKEVEVYQIS
ncbi:MAG: TLD domain-containing protein [Candidatus Pacebacteria bacterium]|nr:TLD domain-containing protein [Candidatus Paceibacterota bacterium]